MAKRKRTNSPRQVDLAFAPKSYWPARTRPGSSEVEVVGIAISSSARDVITVWARRAATGRIRYRMIHGDANRRTGRTIRVKPASSTQPLSLGELIGLLDSACYAAPCPDEGDDERYGGVIWGTLRLHLEHGIEHADDYLFSLRVASRHYPQLERYYAERVNEWCLANCMEDEDCGKVVRLRTGRFPRKLIALG